MNRPSKTGYTLRIAIYIATIPAHIVGLTPFIAMRKLSFGKTVFKNRIHKEAGKSILGYLAFSYWILWVFLLDTWPSIQYIPERLCNFPLNPRSVLLRGQGK